MKQMKKWFVMLIVIVMLVVSCGTAMASETPSYSITIQNSSDSVSIKGNTYYVYQLFDKSATGDTFVVNSAFSGFSYTANGKAYSGANLVAYASTITADGELIKLAAAALGYAVKNGITPVKSVVADAENEVIGLSAPGYYLVSCLPYNPDENDQDAGEQTITAIVAVVADDEATTETDESKPVITIKAEVPAIDKVIVNADSEGGKEGNGTAVDVGSKVEFKLYSKVPSMTGYTSYTYIVHDTMTTGLTPVDKDGDGKIDVTVTIGGQAYTGFTVTHDEKDPQNFTIAFDNFIDQAEKAGDEIVITYAAILNEKALGTNVETNTIYLEYSNDPSDSDSTDETPKDTVYVYDFEIVVNKTNSDKTPLDGAKFVLYKEVAETVSDAKVNVKYYYSYKDNVVSWHKLAENETLADAIQAGKVSEYTTATQNGASSVKFPGLDAGTYYIQETEAPAGYELLPDSVEVTIEADEEKYLDNGQLNGEEISITYSRTIENTTGSRLPETGGMGTTVIYIAGGALVVLAVVLLIIKKRSGTSR